jgi:hypothetical protein
VILLFVRTSSFTQFTFPSILLIFNRCHAAFDLWKPCKNMCSSHSLPSKRYNISKVSIALFASVKWNLMQTHTVLSCLPFSRYTKIANGTTLAPNKTLLNNTSYSLIPSTKWLSRLHLAEEVHVGSSSFISQSGGKSLDYTIYLLTLLRRT